MKRELSSHAAAAKAIRQELKEAFPSISFTVRSRSYAGGESVDIDWIDGPTRDAVEGYVKQYQYGHFDGMTDSYNYTNSRKDIPQVKYVFANRELSDEVASAVFSSFKESHLGWTALESIDQQSSELRDKWGFWSAREYINRYLSDKDLTKGLVV